MKEFVWVVSIICILLVCVAVLLKYLSENKKYKSSSYGNKVKKGFWKIIFNQGARGEYRTSQLIDKAPFKNKMLFNCYIPTGLVIKQK